MTLISKNAAANPRLKSVMKNITVKIKLEESREMNNKDGHRKDILASGLTLTCITVKKRITFNLEHAFRGLCQ